MYYIKLSNSTCQVENLDSSLDKLLKKELRYKDPNTEFSLAKNEREIKRVNSSLDSGRFADTSFLEKKLAKLLHINRGLRKKLFISLYKDGEFPTGLLPKVLELLEYSKLQYEIKDKRKKPQLKKHKFVLKKSLPALRYYQKDASKEVLKDGRGIIVSPTGTGKTTMICKMIWDLGVNTLVITPNKSITDNMMDTLINHFGKGKVDKLNTKSVKIKKPINVINIQALTKVNPKLFSEMDAVFIDEFHHSAATTYREVNLKHLKNCYFRIGVTATNFRNDGADLALESVLSKVLYEYNIPTAIKDEFLVPPEFEFIDTKTWDEGNYQESYKAAIVENKERNQIIIDVATEEYDNKRHVLILVQQVGHGEILQEMLKDLDAKFIHGMTKDLDRSKIMEDFRKGKFRILIGTSVIGEGVDLPIADTLIMAGGGKAKSQVIQNVGRVLRPFKGKEFALIIDFTDEGSRWLEEHSVLREEIYNSEY